MDQNRSAHMRLGTIPDTEPTAVGEGTFAYRKLFQNVFPDKPLMACNVISRHLKIPDTGSVFGNIRSIIMPIPVFRQRFCASVGFPKVIYGSCILPDGKDYTFWGKGVSQGHSDAIRRVGGVVDGKQYTIPVDEAIEAVRSGSNPELTTRQKHRRECFVVAEEGADRARIENEIKTMPNYFADYDTTVNFITEEELQRDHSGSPHGGFVIRSGRTGRDLENSHIIEYSLKLDSNPEFTSSVLVAYARAAYRMSRQGDFGCKTVFDIPPAYLSPKSGEELRATLL